MLFPGFFKLFVLELPGFSYLYHPLASLLILFTTASFLVLIPGFSSCCRSLDSLTGPLPCLLLSFVFPGFTPDPIYPGIFPGLNPWLFFLLPLLGFSYWSPPTLPFSCLSYTLASLLILFTPASFLFLIPGFLPVAAPWILLLSPPTLPSPPVFLIPLLHWLFVFILFPGFSSWSTYSMSYPLFHSRLHCKQDPIYVFPEMKLRGPAPNFYINLSVSDLNLFPRSVHLFFCRKIGGPIVGIYLLLTDTWM